MKMKDGDENKVEAELIFVYQAGDSSVGIEEGFGFAGIEIGQEFIAVEDLVVKRNYGSGEKSWNTFVIDPQDALKLNQIAESLSESVHNDEPPDEAA